MVRGGAFGEAEACPDEDQLRSLGCESREVKEGGRTSLEEAWGGGSVGDRGVLHLKPCDSEKQKG
jgi:hypothetical protein